MNMYTQKMDFTRELRSQVKNKLIQAGITPTRQRLEIGMCLFDCHKHMSADQLQKVVTQLYGEVSKATIYNTLGLFAKSGLLTELAVKPGKVIYDTNISAHQHIYNIDTDEITDVNSDELKISVPPVLSDDIKIDSVDIILKVRNS